MPSRSQLTVIAWALIGVCLAVGAGMFQTPLDLQSREYELNPADVAKNHPAKTLLMVAPGGLRAPIVNYLWIRAESLKQNGRHHEAMQKVL